MPGEGDIEGNIATLIPELESEVVIRGTKKIYAT